MEKKMKVKIFIRDNFCIPTFEGDKKMVRELVYIMGATDFKMLNDAIESININKIKINDVIHNKEDILKIEKVEEN